MNAEPQSPARNSSPLARRETVKKVSESDDLRELTVKNVEAEYLRGQIICNHRLQTVIDFERRDVQELRLKEQGHRDQLSDCLQWEQTVFQLALDEDADRHEQFKRLIELENQSLEQEIREVMQELESIRKERQEQA